MVLKSSDTKSYLLSSVVVKHLHTSLKIEVLSHCFLHKRHIFNDFSEVIKVIME